MQYNAIIKTAEVRVAKNGKNFISVSVGLGGGKEMKGIMFDYNYAAPDPGSNVIIEATEEEYNGNKQLKITKIETTTFTADEMAEFMPVTRESIDVMWENLKIHIDGVVDPDIKKLMSYICGMYEDKIKMCPAAKKMHHSFIGGLLEHMTELCSMFSAIKHQFRYVDPDKVIFGLVMHDMCKIFEYRWDRGVLETSDSGELVPHIPRSTMLLTRAFDQLGTPEDLQMELIHIVQSHHGKIEHGSPVVPRTIDALMVHNLDMLHAQMFNAIGHIDMHIDSGAKWTPKCFGAQNVALLMPKKPVVPVYDDEIPF